MWVILAFDEEGLSAFYSTAETEEEAKAILEEARSKFPEENWIAEWHHDWERVIDMFLDDDNYYY